MGVRGAWSAFRRLFPTIDPTTLNGTKFKIGIDMFSLVYTHRANLEDLLALLNSWQAAGHIFTCVWDGVAPKEKQEIVGQRRSARESAMTKKGDLQEYLEKFEGQLTDTDIKHIKTAITSFSWQGWHLTGSLKKQIQESLGPNTTHIHAEGEADDLLIQMSFDKTIDVIMSLDSDLFVMGGEHIWRLLRIRQQWIVEDIHVEQICNHWGINLSQLQDAAFLAGWDRCHLNGESYMAFESALHRIKYYGQLNTVVEKFVNGDDVVNKEAMDRLKIIKKESRERWIQILNRRK